jgi:hypothetical protein
MKLNIESVNGEKRLFKESDVDDEYVYSLESGDSEYDLNYEYKDDGESDNDNKITKNEEDWLTKWNKYWKWDEIREEYQMILLIIIFNKLIKLKKEKIKNVI